MTSGTRIASIPELVDLLMGSLYRSQAINKRMLGPSMVNHQWNAIASPYIFRRQIIGNPKQLQNAADMSEARGTVKKFRKVVVWNGRNSSWKVKGERLPWWANKAIQENFKRLDLQGVESIEIYGAVGAEAVHIVLQLLGRMMALKRVKVKGAKEWNYPHIALMVSRPSVEELRCETWTATSMMNPEGDFIGAAQELTILGSAADDFFGRQYMSRKAFTSVSIYIASLDDIEGVEFALLCLTNLGKLTRVSLFFIAATTTYSPSQVSMPGDLPYPRWIAPGPACDYPEWLPPTSLRLIAVELSTDMWGARDAAYLIEWLAGPRLWVGLQTLDLRLILPSNELLYEAVQNVEPWRELGRLLGLPVKFPVLESMKVVITVAPDAEEASVNCASNYILSDGVVAAALRNSRDIQVVVQL